MQEFTESIPDLNNITIHTFSTLPESWAKKLAALKEDKPTQIRRFYDEVVKWHEKSITLNEEEFAKQLPFIYMIVAMVEYSCGRGNCSVDFVRMIKGGMQGVKDKQSFHHFKCFFEAFVGYFKAYSLQK
jgi:CRISPR-associated protein Csm2